MSDPIGGTDIAALGISVNSDDPLKAAANLDKMGTATISVVKNLDDLTNATEKNAKWVSNANQLYKNKIELLQAQWRAEQDVISAETQSAAMQQKLSDAGMNLIVKLTELNATFGLSREEIFRLTAAQLGMTAAAEPLIASLEALKLADEQWAIQQKRDTELHLVRQKEYEVEAIAMAKQTAIQEAELAKQQAAIISFEAFKKRTFAENRAEAMRILTEQENTAVALAEKQAIEEIKWNALSVKTRIAELERLKTYQASSAIQPSTIAANFSSAAIADVGNLTKLQEQYAESLAKTTLGHKAAGASAEVMGLNFGNARAKTEVLVLAHEALQGRLTRMPASFMVLMEYTNAASLAMTGMGAVTLGLIATMGLFLYELVKGEQQTKSFNSAITRTNDISGETTASLQHLASAAGAVHGNFKEAYEAAAELTASGKFTRAQIDEVTVAVVNLNHAFGVPIQKSIKEFESLAVHGTGAATANTLEVTKALEKLDEQYHFVNATLMEQVIQLEKQGKQQEASTLGIKAYIDETTRAKERSDEDLGSIERGWNAIVKVVKSAGQAMADVGKGGLERQRAGLQEDVDVLLGGAQGKKDQTPTQNDITNIIGLSEKYKELLSVKKQIADADAAALKVSIARGVQSAADHDLANRAIEDFKLMKKSTTELQDALAKNAAENARIEAAHPGYSEKNADYLKEREAAIIKAHTIIAKGADDRKLIRKDELMNEKADFAIEKGIYDERNKNLDAFHKDGYLLDESYYSGRASVRADYIQAEAASFTAELAVVNRFKPKNAQEVADNQIKYDTLLNQHRAFTAKMNAEVTQDEVKQILDKKAIEDASDAAINAYITTLDKQVKKIDDINGAREASKSAVERETVALYEQAVALMAVQAAGPSGDHTQADADAAAKTLIALQLELDLHKAIAAELEQQEADNFSRKAADQAIKDWKSAGESISHSLSSAFGSGGKAIGEMFKAYAIGQSEQLRLTKELGAAKVLSDTNPDKLKIIDDLQRQSAQAQLKSYADMTDAAEGYFQQGSKGYQAMHAASQIMHAAEVALSLIKGVNAVLTQGSGDPYSAFARMAAMSAIVVGLGVAISSGSSSGGQSSADAQKAQGSGSVFGDTQAKSDSIVRSMTLLTNNSSIGLQHTAGMLEALRAIQSSMTGLSNLIARSTGITDGGNFGIKTGQLNAKGSPVDIFSKTGTAMTDVLFGPLGGKIAGFINNLWGKVTANIVDSGLQFGGSVRNLQAGQGYNQYASVDTTTSSWFGLSKSTSNSVQTQGLNNELTAQFGMIFTNLEKSLKAAATGIGIGSDQVTKALDGLTIDTTKISLKGLSGTALTDALNAVISKTMDAMAQAAFPSFDQFRKVGEGYAETVLRVATDYANLDSILNATGMTFGAIGVDSLAAREKLIDLAGGINALAGQSKSFADNFLSQAERLAPVQRYVIEQLASMGLAGVTTREQFKTTVLGLNLTTDAGQQQYVAMMNLADAFAQTHAATVDLTKSEQAIADERRNLQDQLDQLTMTSAQLLDKQRSALDSSNRALFDQIQGIIALRDAATAAQKVRETAMAAVDTSLAGLSRSIAAEKTSLQATYDARVKSINDQLALDKKAAQDQLSLATNTASAISSVYSSLTSSLNSIQELSRETAQSVLRAALAHSNAGGSLVNYDGLSQALQAVAKPSEDLFATFNDYKRDQGLTADTISRLASNAGAQKTVADLTVTAINNSIKSMDDNAKELLATLGVEHTADIARLDLTMSIAQQQVDYLKGIDNSTLSIAQSLNNLHAAITGATGAGVASNLANANAGLPASNSSTSLDVVKAYGTQYGADAYYFNSSNDYAAKLKAAGANARNGESPQEMIAKIFGHSDLYWKTIDTMLKAGQHPTASDSSIPGFSGGGTFTGGLRVVGENGPELEATGASRIFNAQQTSSMLGGNNREMLDELKNIKADNKALHKMMQAHLYALAKHSQRGADALEESAYGQRTLQVTVVA